MQKKLDKDRLILICDRVIEFCIYGFIFFLPISNALIEVFVGWSIFALVVKKITQKKFPKTALNFPIVIYFFALLVSVVFSSYVLVSLRTVFAKILHYVAFYFAVFEVIADKRILRNTIIVMGFSLLLVCIDGIQQYFTHFDFIRRRQWPWVHGIMPVKGRISACFTTANGFSSYLATIGIIIFSFAINLRNKIHKILFIVIFVISFICLCLALTRSSWFSFGMVFLFFAILNKKNKIISYSLLFFILTLGVLYFVNDLFRDRIVRVFIFSDVSSIDRVGLWKMCLHMFKDSPIWGKGIGTFMQNFSKYSVFPASKQVCYAHNSFFQLLAEGGVLGLGSFCLMIAVVFSKALKGFFSDKQYCLKIVQQGFLASLLAFLINAFFDNHFYSLAFSLLFWFLIAVNLSLLNNNYDERMD